jgi:hypothetical protein
MAMTVSGADAREVVAVLAAANAIATPAVFVGE